MLKRTLFPWFLAMLAAAVLLGLSWPRAGAAGPEVSAESAVVLSGDGSAILYEKDAHARRPAASTTKIMTALLTLEEAARLGDPVVEITEEMTAVEGSSMGLEPGDMVPLSGLAAGMLLASGNDGANAAALYLAGSLEAFARRMNARAEELGMEDTYFVTPSGLDGQDAQGRTPYSSAFDLAILAREALENQEFLSLCASPSAEVAFAKPEKNVTLENHNRLLGEYPGCVGVKTGYTRQAGRCLVSAARRDGALVIAVTLDAPDDWDDHKALLDYGFSQLEGVALSAGDVRLTVPVVGSSQQWLSLRGGDGGAVALPPECRSRVRREVMAPRFLYAPVQVGETVGQVRWYLDDVLLGTAPLTAGEAAPALEKDPGFWARLFDTGKGT